MLSKLIVTLCVLLAVNAETVDISYAEMDKMMTCSFIIGGRLNQDKDEVLKVIKRIGEEKGNQIQNKISYEMFEFCYNKIDNKTVSSYFKNLTLVGFEWSKNLEKFSEVNYASYDNNTSLELTVNQMSLGMKFEQVKQIYEDKKIEAQREERKTLKIGTVDINQIPPIYKLIFFIVVISTFIFGILYLLKKVDKTKVSKKQKKTK